jgi:hypothetical protein
MREQAHCPDPVYVVTAEDASPDVEHIQNNVEASGSSMKSDHRNLCLSRMASQILRIQSPLRHSSNLSRSCLNLATEHQHHYQFYRLQAYNLQCKYQITSLSVCYNVSETVCASSMLPYQHSASQLWLRAPYCWFLLSCSSAVS